MPTTRSLGILLCLPAILAPDEVVEYVSLGAGNAGKRFDLETNKRIAEFKFITWRGGPESIRQNSLLKDSFLRAECDTHKERFLYVLGSEYPLRFFRGQRALSSVLKDHVVREFFFKTFGDTYRTVGDYYTTRKDRVVIEDVSRMVSSLAESLA